MRTTSTETVKDTFTMIDDNLLAASIQQITAQQKLLISWILRWQKNDKECFASNQKIAETFGMTKEGIKSLLKSCTYSFPTFFECTPDTRDNGVPFHTITIDIEELMKFLIDRKPVNKIKRRNKLTNENKAIKEPISIEVIEEDLKEIIVAKIEDKPSIKASDIPRQPIQVKVLEIPVPVIENKIDLIDLKNLSVEDFHIKTNNEYTYANSKIFNPIITSIILKIKTGEFSFQQGIAECEHLKNEYIKRDNKIKQLA